MINRSFNPLESILFLAGFIGLLLTTGLLSVYVSREAKDHGVTFAACPYLAVAAALGAVSFAFDQFGRHAFAASDNGLHGEWSCFSIGIAHLLISAWTAGRDKQLD